jgi:hypothetical protein
MIRYFRVVLREWTPWIVLVLCSCSDGVLDSGAGIKVSGDTDTSSTSDPDRCEGGVDEYGICWYMSNELQNCTLTCESRGGVAPEASAYVGSIEQGGSREECAFLLNLILKSYVNVIAIPAPATQQGLGCYRFMDGLYWITDIPFDAGEGCYGTQIVCGCVGNEAATP